MILILLNILGIFVLNHVNCQGPPEVTGSYKAYGEIVLKVEDKDLPEPVIVQAQFVENYDASTKNAAFTTWEGGHNLSIIEDGKTNQIFQYLDKSICDTVTIKDLKSSPPALLSYEDTNGTIRFSLKQLFAFKHPEALEKKEGEPTFYRGMPAKKWIYKMEDKDVVEKDSKHILIITAYWSDGTWNMSSQKSVTPLGYNIDRMEYKTGKVMKINSQAINIYGFLENTFDRKIFEPVEGLICPNRTQTIQFPDIKEFRALSLRSEFILLDSQEIRHVDTWYDIQNKLVRVNLDHLIEEPAYELKERKFTTEVTSGKLGAIFRMDWYKGKFSCNIFPIQNYSFDIQNLINIKLDLKDWKIGKLFGLNDTSYVYVGQTTKRNIPCLVYQGIRKDWPEPSANIVSLWEWCFAIPLPKESSKVIMRGDEFPLINAQITILESGQKNNYPPGYKYNHHFYDVIVQKPEVMAFNSFDISGCFSNEAKKALQFVVDYKIDMFNLHTFQNATSDLSFLKQWKSVIEQKSGLPSYSLRVAKVQATVEKMLLYIKFHLLDIHKDLPEEAKKGQKSLFDAEQSLRQAINKDDVAITYKPSKKSKIMPLQAQKHTLTDQINHNFEPHTPPTTIPTTTTTTKLTPFSLITDEDEKSSRQSTGSSSSSPTGTTNTRSIPISYTPTSIKPTTTTNKQPQIRILQKGHSKGTVAAVTIIMLLIGITIGSSGTFVKYKGLPSCLKRSNNV